jgi:hypothetical protein
MSDTVIELSQFVRIFPPLFVAALVASSWFAVKSVTNLLTALFSNESRKKISARPVFLFSWMVTIPLSVFLFFLVNPSPLKLQKEKRIAFERVQAAGGWEAIKRDCWLLTNQPNGYLVWHRRGTNYSDLPPAVAALKPIEVRGFPDEQLHVPVIRIHVLGIADTDSCWPYLGYWIVCGDTPTDYKPHFDFGARNFKGRVTAIANSVFEIR